MNDQTINDLTVTLLQQNLLWEDAPANLRNFEAALESSEQKTTSPEVILLPEMFTTGFTMNTSLSETMTGPTVQWLRDLSGKYKALVMGSLIVKEGGKIHNRLVAVRENETFTYDKAHLFPLGGENLAYSRGSNLTTIIHNGWKIRPYICYDLRFPLWMRNFPDTTGEAAYDVAVVVANWPASRTMQWQSLLIARAIENQSYIIGLNRVGTDGNGIAYCGDSLVIDPTGTVVAHLGDGEAVGHTTLSASLLEETRRNYPFLRDGDSHLVKGDA